MASKSFRNPGVDTVVVGAGVVGLAVARAVALSGRSVLIVEQASQIGTETSARSSEVIHAGIYYPPGSLKAELCRRGNTELYDYARARGIPHRRIGKLIVAVSEDQIDALAALQANGEACGVEGLAWLEPGQVRAMEPELNAKAALLSPSSGIVDSHALMMSLLADAEAAGALIALRTRVQSIGPRGNGLGVRAGDMNEAELRTRCLVNAAGLHAQELARRIEGIDPACIPPSRFLKGYYFLLTSTRCPFSRLVYPVPDGAGLGIHATLDLAGRCRFGPDAVEWVDRIDYSFDESRADAFYEAVREYWPGLPPGSLSPGFAGIRPKIHGRGESWQDFRIQGPEQHGIDGLVNLFAIDSPGLTSALAIGRKVADMTG